MKISHKPGILAMMIVSPLALIYTLFVVPVSILFLAFSALLGAFYAFVYLPSKTPYKQMAKSSLPSVGAIAVVAICSQFFNRFFSAQVYEEVSGTIQIQFLSASYIGYLIVYGYRFSLPGLKPKTL